MIEEVSQHRNQAVWQSRWGTVLLWGRQVFLKIPMVVFYVFFFVSLLSLEYFNFHLSPDLSLQLNSLINFVHGNGISLAVLAGDNQIVYQPLSWWPAGFVIFLYPFYIITKSTVAAAVMVKMAAYFFLMVFLSKYFNFLRLDLLKRRIIIIFFTTAISPFVHFYPSDTVACVLCLWGFLFNLRFQNNGRWSDLVKSVLFIALSYFVKYSFMPFIFYPVFSFALSRRKELLRNWQKLFLISLIALAAISVFYFLNYQMVGPSTQVSNWDAFHGRPYWKQLLRTDGFLFTFGNYEWRLETFLKNQFQVNLQFNWISLLVTGMFYLLIIGAFFSKRDLATGHPFTHSLNISLSAGTLIFLFLAILTINNPGQTWTIPHWTFVEETRYYGPVIIIGLINILILLLSARSKISRYVLAFLVLTNVCAYTYILKDGYWGMNANTYFGIRENIMRSIHPNEGKVMPIVYFDPASKHSNEYFYLQSQGMILVEELKTGISGSPHNSVGCYYIENISTGKNMVSPCD